MLHKNLADPDHLKKYTIASLKKILQMPKLVCVQSWYTQSFCTCPTIRHIHHRGSTTFEVRALLQKRDNSRATSSDIMYETKDSQN